MHKFEKLMAHKMKNGKKMSDTEHKAKKSVLGEMKQMASDMMGDKIKGLKKSEPESKEGVKSNLDQSRSLLGGSGHDQHQDHAKEGTPSEEAGESSAEEMKEEVSQDDEASVEHKEGHDQIHSIAEQMDEPNLDHAIKKLHDLKEQKRKGHSKYQS